MDALDKVDVKKMEIDHPDPKVVKWFRFGGYTGVGIAAEVIKYSKKKTHKP